MPPTRDGVTHDPITNVLINILDEFSVEYTEDPQHPIANLKRSQVRDEKNVGSRETVHMLRSKFATGMPIPAIVVTADDVIIDGNGRYITAEALKRPTLYALVTKKTAEQLGPFLLETLGSRMNDHGKRRQKEEIDRSIRRLLEGDATTEKVMEHLSVEANRVRNMRAQMTGEQRLAELGMARNGFSLAHLKTLGRTDMLAEPFKAVVELTHDAGLTSKELVDLIKRARAKDSEADQLALLQNERQDLRERIDEHKRTGNGQPPLAREIRLHINKLLALLPSDLDGAVERNPDRIEDQVRLLQDALTAIGGLAERQQAEAQRAGITLL